MLMPASFTAAPRVLCTDTFFPRSPRENAGWFWSLQCSSLADLTPRQQKTNFQ